MSPTESPRESSRESPSESSGDPALSLGSAPQGVHEARQWVVQRLAVLERPDLSECAELAVSELVTNALLHATPPVEITIGGTPEHPRVQVRDASTVPPPVTVVESCLDDELLTYGRGLCLVARGAVAWGADLDESGKIVWFEPATDFSEEAGPEGVVTGESERVPMVDADDRCAFRLLGVPWRSYLAFQRHYRELRREVRLLALAHEASYPMARDLAQLFGALDQPLSEGLDVPSIPTPPLDEGSGGVDATPGTADLQVTMSLRAAAQLGRFGELLTLADAFSREAQLLSLARTAELARFERWFLGEFVRQAAGEAPLRWSPDPTTEPRDSPPPSIAG